MTVNGQKVVVFGGSSGMGLATARAAALDGANVVVASSNPERIRTALSELPDGCDGLVVDVRDEEQIEGALDQIGEFDHLVFTAGDTFTPTRLAGLDLRDAHAMMKVRFWGSVTVIKHAIARIRTAGSISLTTGTVGRRPIPGAAIAAAGAGAIEGLVRALAVELAPIRVNAVRAGAFRTPMWDGLPEAQREVVFGRLAQNTLVGAVGDPAQIAAAHLYLMQNSYVTGTVLGVDGGSLLTAG